jgi:hypothetical protein
MGGSGSATASNFHDQGAVMWDRLLELLPLGCRHRHISLPFSAAPSARRMSNQEDWDSVSASGFGMYVVCLDCGRHFDYDWSQMRVVK